MLRAVLTVSGIVVAGWLALVVLAWVAQERLIFLPDTSSPGPVPPGVEEVVLRTDDGIELGAWFVTSRPGHAQAAVLVANGNAGNRAGRLPLAQSLAERGHHVLVFDYRGYGGNPGRPRVATLIDDVRAAHDHLVGRDDVRAIIGYGESIGALGVAALAAERPLDGLVLRSPPSSLADVGSRAYPFLPVRTLLRDDVDVTAAVAGHDGPLLVVLGTADRIVAPELSRRVAGAVPGARLVEVDGAGHNDPAMFDGQELIDAVDALVREVR